MMMKQHHNQHQQQQQQMNGMNGGGQGGQQQPSPIETKWWYKGPDGETYGPYKSHEMLTWGKSGYFSDGLPVKTENDDSFHPIGDWTTVMGGANPFANASVPAFHILVHGAQQQQQQYLLYPPGLPAPAPFNSNGSGAGGPGARYGGPPPYLPPTGPAAAAMANLHLGAAHMAMHPMHHGGPLSQPPSEPNDGPNSSQSHSPDGGEPDFRSLHQMNAAMGGMPPPVPPMHGGRMQYGYGMQPPMPQQQQPQQGMGGGGGGVATTHMANGQMQYTRVTSTQDAPWNSKREIAVDATQRAPQRATIATQTLPVIIGSKDASRLLSDLTGCSIVIT